MNGPLSAARSTMTEGSLSHAVRYISFKSGGTPGTDWIDPENSKLRMIQTPRLRTVSLDNCYAKIFGPQTPRLEITHEPATYLHVITTEHAMNNSVAGNKVSTIVCLHEKNPT